jgi:hypothetical protein
MFRFPPLNCRMRSNGLAFQLRREERAALLIKGLNTEPSDAHWPRIRHGANAAAW